MTMRNAVVAWLQYLLVVIVCQTGTSAPDRVVNIVIGALKNGLLGDPLKSLEPVKPAEQRADVWSNLDDENISQWLYSKPTQSRCMRYPGGGR